jgi:hypothetical protein
MRARSLAALAVLAFAGFATGAPPALAGTNVSVSLGLPVAVAPAPVVVAPQPVYVQQPPAMAVIPGSAVYFAPGVSVDLFFYDGSWWNRNGDRWYRGNAYNGPWTAVGPRHVPSPVYRVPANYRTVYVHEKPMPYGQWKKAHGKHGEGHHKGKHGGKHGHHDD